MVGRYSKFWLKQKIICEVIQVTSLDSIWCRHAELIADMRKWFQMDEKIYSYIITDNRITRRPSTPYWNQAIVLKHSNYDKTINFKLKFSILKPEAYNLGHCIWGVFLHRLFNLPTISILSKILSRISNQLRTSRVSTRHKRAYWVSLSKVSQCSAIRSLQKWRGGVTHTFETLSVYAEM